MKHGAEYLHSAEKRKFDLKVARAGKPAEVLTRLALSLSVRQSSRQMIFLQERIGTNDHPFMMNKLRTLDDDGNELNALAKFYRKVGLDELAQLECIIKGDMSLFGARPLLSEEDKTKFIDLPDTREVDNLLKRHKELVAPAKPGIGSSWAFGVHRGLPPTPLNRLRSEVFDHENAGFLFDLRIFASGILSILRQEMTHSHIRPETQAEQP